MSALGNVTLRPATAADDEFLCAVYGSTREEELAQVPWTEAQRAQFIRFQFEAQLRHYQTEYPKTKHQIILLDGEPVGRLYLDARREELRLLDLTLLPAFRGQGIGTLLLRRYQEEAARAGKSLSIHLDAFSQSQSLFLRLGFTPGASTGFHTLYVWQPELATGVAGAATAEAD